MQAKYKVTFYLSEKIDVNGPDAHPVFVYLRVNSELYDRKSGQMRKIPWNFSKFLVNNKGKVVKYFPPLKSMK